MDTKSDSTERFEIEMDEFPAKDRGSFSSGKHVAFGSIENVTIYNRDPESEDDDEKIEFAIDQPSSSSSNYSHSQPQPSTSRNFSNSNNEIIERDRDNLSICSQDFGVGEVRLRDLTFALLFLIVTFFECLTSVSLVVLHYCTNYKWASGLTAFFIVLGSLGVLHFFNINEMDKIMRIFNSGKRKRICVNIFPPLGLLVTSLELCFVGKSALEDQMQANRFFELKDFAKSISKSVSFAQSAPLTALNIILFVENHNEYLIIKGIVTLINIFCSLILMTFANFPDNSQIALQNLPKEFTLGIRLFSNLGARMLSLSYFFVSLRCVFGDSGRFSAFTICLVVCLFPRLFFTLNEVSKNRSNNSNNPRLRNELPDSSTIFYSYLVTLFFPVGEPFWLFCYIWMESTIFILTGNIIGWSFDCLSNNFNAFYTGLFIILFLIVPIILPFANSKIKNLIFKTLGICQNNRSNQLQNLENF